ncbi:MAG TPA: rhodanese-like domain-containing protein [Candidatus Acidoferrales bacterium]|nr:rhodanese-like domain-containing protein [Candidatus Acidoferrales bacterium]
MALFVVFACLSLLWTGASQASHGREEINYISPDRVKALIDGGEKIFFLDIRPEKEYQEKRVAGARSIPARELEKRLNEVPRAGRIIVYCDCRPGGEDADAYFVLRDNGYRNVAVMEEGIRGWVRRKFPTEQDRR